METPKYRLTEQHLQQLNKELLSLQKEVEQHLLEKYKRSLYY